MLHVLQYLQGVVHQLVALATVDVYHHTHTTSVVLVITLVESLAPLLTSCHIILINLYVCPISAAKVMQKAVMDNSILLFFYSINCTFDTL